MKEWQKLTDEELAQLSDKQIGQYEKLICAKEGVVFDITKPEKPEIPEPDLTVYSITGLGFGNVCFADLGDANKLLMTLKQLRTLGTKYYVIDSTKKYRQGTELDYAGKPMQMTITSEEVYSKNTVSLDVLKEEMYRYNNNLREYNEKTVIKNEILKEFRTALKVARDAIGQRKYLSELYYKEYLPLAGGDGAIAMNFLKKAYTVSDEDEQYILNNLSKLNTEN